jgi:hypothetical protein
MTEPVERNLGAQPLDALLTGLGLDNHDLVAASPQPLTHKAVQRGRKGRRLTPHMQRRIAEALGRAAAAAGAGPRGRARHGSSAGGLTRTGPAVA